MSSLADRMEALVLKTERVETHAHAAKVRVEHLGTQIEDLASELAVLDRVSDLFKHLIEKHVDEYADSFSQIVTEGLQTIYHDQDVSFGIRVEQKRGKIYASFVTKQAGREGEPLKSFGGGVAAIESLLLRLLVLLKADLARYLFLDESLAALSVEYVEGCGEFLRELCDRLGVNVLLVTHNDGVLEHATRAYKGTMGADQRLRLECVRDSDA